MVLVLHRALRQLRGARLPQRCLLALVLAVALPIVGSAAEYCVDCHQDSLDGQYSEAGQLNGKPYYTDGQGHYLYWGNTLNGNPYEMWWLDSDLDPGGVDWPTSGYTSATPPVGTWSLGSLITSGACPPQGIVLEEFGGSTEVTEGGAGDTITLRLESDPREDVTIAVFPDDQLDIGYGPGIPHVYEYADGVDNWTTPFDISVSAADDSVAEGEHEGSIRYETASLNTHYNNLSETIPT